MIGIFSLVIVYCVNVSSLDDTESEEANVASEFWETLEEIEAQFSKKDEKTEWTRRKENLEGNWMNSRITLFNYLLLKECIPDTHIECYKCSENVAVIRCEACRELMCSDCDNEIHSRNPFHDRQVWLNGFYQGISNNHTVIDGALAPVGMIHLFLSSVLI